MYSCFFLSGGEDADMASDWATVWSTEAAAALSFPLLGGFIRAADGMPDSQEALWTLKKTIFSQGTNLSV